jgi:tryptophan-rich sensory protein
MKLSVSTRIFVREASIHDGDRILTLPIIVAVVITLLRSWHRRLDDGWTHASGNSQQLPIITLFGINIVLHMLWSPLFFNLKRPDWALIEVPFLWLSIVALMFGLAPFSALASWLLLPYLLWVAFAAFLNLAIVRMNRPFGRIEPSKI